jgi:hypothetical protein
MQSTPGKVVIDSEGVLTPEDAFFITGGSENDETQGVVSAVEKYYLG